MKITSELKTATQHFQTHRRHLVLLVRKFLQCTNAYHGDQISRSAQIIELLVVSCPI